jgi:hypothetical protein
MPFKVPCKAKTTLSLLLVVPMLQELRTAMLQQ